MSKSLEFAATTAPHTVIEIFHPKDHIFATDTPAATQDKLVELISTIAAHIIILPDEGHKFLETLIRDERGFGRALLITNMKTMIGNVLGNSPKIRISDWGPKDHEREPFPLLRKEAWNQSAAKSSQKVEMEPPKFGKGDPPPDLFDVESLKHSDRKVLSLINMDLWNKAGWGGTGFATSPDPSELPILAFVFKDLQAAKDIFAGWRAELGESDSDEKLRVSVITGISSENPSTYRVVIGTNLNSISSKSTKGHLILVYRINQMYPTSSANLDRFLESYRKNRKYLLVPAKFGPEGIPVFAPELGILKRELYVRPAWQIERNDPDACGIDADDKIIIPDGVSDAPVLETLAWKKKKDKKRRPSSFSSPSAVRVGTAGKKIGRNDPCFCGSGKKYKKCHGT